MKNKREKRNFEMAITISAHLASEGFSGTDLVDVVGWLVASQVKEEDLVVRFMEEFDSLIKNRVKELNILKH